MYGALWSYLKRCSWGWNCWESKDTKWYILALFKTKEVGTAEKILEARRTRNSLEVRNAPQTPIVYKMQNYLKQCFGSCNCLEYFETKEAKWCIRTIFERWFGSSNCLNLKRRKLNGAFCRYLKRCFRGWNCLEHFESKEAKCCSRTLSEECGRRLLGELLNVELCSSLKYLLIRLYNTM